MSDSSMPVVATSTGEVRARPSPVSEILTVFRWEFRHLFVSLRTLIPMLVYAGFGALSVFGFLKASNAVAQAGVDPAKLAHDTGELLGRMLTFVGWGDQGTAAEILRDHVPMLVLYFFGMASFFLPLLVAVVSFDQFSDLSTRGARFPLLRVRRESFFAGKALAAVASVAGFLLAMWVVVIAVAVKRADPGEVSFALREGLRAWALMCVLSLPYLAITALVSSFAKPGIAFIGTIGAWIGLGIAETIVHHLPAAARDVLQPVFPWDHAPALISRYAPTLWTGVGALVLISAVLYGLTLLYVRSRDV